MTRAHFLSSVVRFKRPVTATVSAGIIRAANGSRDPLTQRLVALAGKEVKIRGAVTDGAWIIGAIKPPEGMSGFDPINLIYVDQNAQEAIRQLLTESNQSSETVKSADRPGRQLMKVVRNGSNRPAAR